MGVVVLDKIGMLIKGCLELIDLEIVDGFVFDEVLVLVVVVEM